MDTEALSSEAAGVMMAGRPVEQAAIGNEKLDGSAC